MPVMKVIVLYGGISTEHEVSVHSAQTVCRTLASQPEKYTVYPVFISKTGRWFLQQKCGPQTPQDIAITPVLEDGVTFRSLQGNVAVRADVVFPVLHGTNGEDGVMQGFLETLQIPYVGCNVLASAIGMDKELSKRMAQATGVPIVAYRKITKEAPYDEVQLLQWAQRQGYPLFVKPVRLGSSVGVRKVTSPKELPQAIAFALQFDTAVLVEKGIEAAREIFCAVYGDAQKSYVSQPGELCQNNSEFFDYNTKYLVTGGCDMHIPADVPAPVAQAMQRDTELIFKALQTSGLARVDFLMDRQGNYFFSEINTIPGLSETSLFPQLFEAGDHAYSLILDRLIDLALQTYKNKKSLTVSRL